MKYKVGDMSNFKKKWDGEPADMAGPLKRPYGMTGAAKHNVYLDQYTWAKLRLIGKGNASKAIRKLSARNEELENALRESQDWNWISAHEYMIDNSIEKYPIEEMQRLSLVAATP